MFCWIISKKLFLNCFEPFEMSLEDKVFIITIADVKWLSFSAPEMMQLTCHANSVPCFLWPILLDLNIPVTCYLLMSLNVYHVSGKSDRWCKSSHYSTVTTLKKSNLKMGNFISLGTYLTSCYWKFLLHLLLLWS